jgi:hypothetical protein
MNPILPIEQKYTKGYGALSYFGHEHLSAVCTHAKVAAREQVFTSRIKCMRLYTDKLVVSLVQVVAQLHDSQEVPVLPANDCIRALLRATISNQVIGVLTTAAAIQITL